MKLNNKGQRILTDGQARNLLWFCENVAGVQQEFYKIEKQFEDFKLKLDRLDKTRQMLENFFGEEIKARKEVDWNESELTNDSEGTEKVARPAPGERKSIF